MTDVERAMREACAGARWEEAVTLGLAGYGPELIGYLLALTRNASDADDLFATVSERLWRSLPQFRWDSSFRTYAYTVARNAWRQHVRRPHQRAAFEPLSSPHAVAALARARTQTATYLRTETRDRIDALRAALAPDDQALLILRVNRRLSWLEIAQVMIDDDAVDDKLALARRAASLRKRFERLKLALRSKAGHAAASSAYSAGSCAQNMSRSV